MAVNTNVYGTAEQWIDSSFNRYITDKNKVAYFAANQSRLENGVSSGKLSYSEPIDKSLSYCGLGEESALSHIGYIYKVGGSYDVQEWQDNFVTNFAFFQQNSTNIDMSPTREACKFDDNEIYKYLAWQATQSSYNKNKYLQPYTSINPKNLVLCIYVRVTNNNMTDYREVDLSTYISTYKTTYPRIICAYVEAFFNNQAWTEANPRRTISGDMETSLNGNLRTLSYGRLDNYKCEGKNFDIHSYFLNDCTIFGSSSRAETLIYNDKMLFVMATEACKPHVHLYLTGGDRDYMNAYIEYFEGVEDEILKTVACFGLYFTPSASVATSGKLTNNDMYIGILDENGIGHGEYLRGADTVNAPQNEYTDMNESGYDYTKDVDKTKYKNDTEFYDSTLANGFTRFWVLDSNGVSQVLNEMYDIMNEVDPDEPIERYSQKVFLTNNPIDCIISLKKFPVLHIPSLTGAYFVNFGSKATSISAYPLAKSCETYTFNFSAANDTSLYPVFGGDFRDFEPYTKCEIVIPFCGSVDVPCCYFYQYGGITVKLTIDFISGACTGFVLANGITISSVSGNCAIDLPVSGIQSATLDSQIFSAAQAKKQNFNKTRAGLVASALTATAGAITGNPVMIAAGAAGVLATAVNSKETVKNIDYELQHLQTPYKEVSTASGQISQSFDMRCKLIITRPKMLSYDENAYAETVGYACLNSGSVDSFHGLTYGTIELNGVPCTADEKSYIESMFANGVHLPTSYP